MPSVASPGSVASRGAEDVGLPRPIFNPEIAYPPGYSESGIGGKVKLFVTVTADGRVKDIAVHETSGYPALDSGSALRACDTGSSSQRRFGTPIEYACVVPINFRPGGR